MLKRSLLLFLFCFLVLTATSYAHTHLEDSNPKNGETIETELRQVTLYFDTDIEHLSTMEMMNEKQEQVPIDDIVIEGNEMTGHFNHSLANGSYTVLWNIVGADGHPTDGEVSFTVLREEPAEEAIEENQILIDGEAAPSEEGDQDQSNSEPVTDIGNGIQDVIEEDQPNHYPILILIVLILIAVLIWWVRRRKAG